MEKKHTETKPQMISYSKKELAQLAGVSRQTFSRWLIDIEPKLRAMGYKRKMRLLPPQIVKCISDHYCIILDAKASQ